MTASLGLAVAITLLLPSLAPAQIYRWEDQSGTVYFSNAPDRSSVPDRVPEAHRSQAGPLPAPAPVEAAREPATPPATRDEPIVVARALTRIPFSPGAPIIVSARLSDSSAPVNLILDTGADRTIVAPQALWRLGISTQNGSRAVIMGVTGSGHADVIQVSSVQVGDAKVGPLRIVAHDANLKQADGLLGRDFLEHFTVTIDAREQIVTLSPK